MILDSIPPLLRELRSGTLSVLDLVDLLEIRFGETEDQVQAWVPEEGRFDRLRRQAMELTMLFGNRTRRPPLFGLPVGVKDIFHVEDLPTQAGSLLPTADLAGEEAEVVQRLKEAGALIVGKTVTTEFAYFQPGPTHNPHRSGHTPGGSSSGSAAAVAARTCSLALGTQTIGSIIRPASYCGVFGFKPTYERISREGVIPLSESFDHVGFFTPDLDGAEVVAALLCETWHRGDTRDEPETVKPSLAIPVGPYLDKASTEAREHLTQHCERLRQAGWRIVEIEVFRGIDDLEERHRRLVAADAARHHRSWYEQHASLYRPKTAELIELGGTVEDAERDELREGRGRLHSGLRRRMDEHGVDAWLTPAAPGPAPEGLDSTGNPIMNLPFSHAGMPSLALPAGTSSEGLPLGLQLVARQSADEALFVWGRQLLEVMT